MAEFSYRLSLVALAAAVGIGSATLAATANAQGVGLAADRSSRELLIVHDAMRNERIDTIDRGQVQLLFADQSTLSIAPGSDVVINEFLYDPETQTGNLTATVTTGVVRYVGGGISRKRDVVFYTPTAAVAVRGGIILIKAEHDTRLGRGGSGKTEMLFLSGDRMCVTADGQSQCTTKSDTAITSESGESPSAPVAVMTETVRALFSNLQVPNGGAPPETLAQSAGQTMPAAGDALSYQISNRPR